MSTNHFGLQQFGEGLGEFFDTSGSAKLCCMLNQLARVTMGHASSLLNSLPLMASSLALPGEGQCIFYKVPWVIRAFWKKLSLVLNMSPSSSQVRRALPLLCFFAWLAGMLTLWWGPNNGSFYRPGVLGVSFASFCFLSFVAFIGLDSRKLNLKGINQESANVFCERVDSSCFWFCEPCNFVSCNSVFEAQSRRSDVNKWAGLCSNTISLTKQVMMDEACKHYAEWRRQLQKTTYCLIPFIGNVQNWQISIDRK